MMHSKVYNPEYTHSPDSGDAPLVVNWKSSSVMPKEKQTKVLGMLGLLD